MSSGAKRRVVSRVTQSGALPVSRDAPGYAAVLGVLGVVDTCEVGTSGGDGTSYNGLDLNYILPWRVMSLSRVW